MKRAAMIGLALLAAVGATACAEDGMLPVAPRNAAPTTRTRALSVSRPTTSQKTQLDQFSKQEGRTVELKKDPFGNGVLSPTLSATETTLLKALDADRRSVEEAGSRTEPGGLRDRAAEHFHFFYPQQKTAPRIVPLYQAQSHELIGFRAEVELTGNNPEDGHDLYFAYYGRDGKLLAANG